MMFVLALGLLLTSSSVVTAGFFSPTPQKQNVILKEGHRTVVVEYEKDDDKTKIQISPQDRIKEQEAEDGSNKYSPKELVCDAYGKCKDKIVNVMGKSKDMANEKAHEAAEKVYDVKGEMNDAISRVKDTAADSAFKAYDKAKETKEKVTQKAEDAKLGAERKVHDVVDNAYEKMEGVKEKGKEAKEMVGNVKDKVKREGEKGLSLIFRYLVGPVGGVLHLMGFSAAYGICVWVTFASSYVLANVLPRQQFAIVQSKIYPIYFKAMASSVGMAFLGHLMGLRKLFSPLSLNLLASMVMVLVNMMYLEPRATKVMFERMKKEKEEGRGKESHSTETETLTTTTTTTTTPARAGAPPTATTTPTPRGGKGKPEEAPTEAVSAKSSTQIDHLSEIMRRLNSYSSFLNVLTLMSLTWHLVHLGQRLYTGGC